MDKVIEIQARRWFDSQWGNTYHSVIVYVNSVEIGRNRFQYGYDEQYLQTALSLLQDAGVYPKTGEHLTSGVDKDLYNFDMERRAHRENFIISVSDVKRKRDLHGVK